MLHPTPAYHNADFPTDASGRSYHISVKRGEIANRLFLCGDVHRVELLSQFLDKKLFELTSDRGFYTVTGLIGDVPITLQASLMGYPNLDFAIREDIAMVDGTLVAIRFGTCGSPTDACNIGDLALADECRGIYRNPDAFRHSPSSASLERYHFTLPVPADPDLLKHLRDTLTKQFPDTIKLGTTFSGCSFYSSQGRPSSVFDDQNEDILSKIASFPKAIAVEMETFHLFDLADISRGRLRAAGSALIIAARQSKGFINPETKEHWVLQYGKALLHALATFPIPETVCFHHFSSLSIHFACFARN